MQQRQTTEMEENVWVRDSEKLIRNEVFAVHLCCSCSIIPNRLLCLSAWFPNNNVWYVFIRWNSRIKRTEDEKNEVKRNENDHGALNRFTNSNREERMCTERKQERWTDQCTVYTISWINYSLWTAATSAAAAAAVTVSLDMIFAYLLHVCLAGAIAVLVFSVPVS